MEAVAAGDDVAFEHVVRAVMGEGDARAVGLDLVHGHVGDLEEQRQAGRHARRDEVLDDLGLTVDDDHPPAGQLAHRHVMTLPVELQVDAAVDDALAVHALADARIAQQVDRALLQHAGTDALLDVLARAVLEDYRLDALARKQLRQRQSGRPGAHDPDLGPHAPKPN